MLRMLFVVALTLVSVSAMAQVTFTGVNDQLGGLRVSLGSQQLVTAAPNGVGRMQFDVPNVNGVMYNCNNDWHDRWLTRLDMNVNLRPRVRLQVRNLVVEFCNGQRQQLQVPGVLNGSTVRSFPLNAMRRVVRVVMSYRRVVQQPPQPVRVQIASVNVAGGPVVHNVLTVQSNYRRPVRALYLSSNRRARVTNLRFIFCDGTSQVVPEQLRLIPGTNTRLFPVGRKAVCQVQLRPRARQGARITVWAETMQPHGPVGPGPHNPHHPHHP